MFKYLKVNKSSQWTVNPRIDFCKDHSTLDPVAKEKAKILLEVIFISPCWVLFHVVLKSISSQHANGAYLLKGSLA